MKKEWIHPNTVTGDAATEGRYLKREYINESFWREVRKGNHILLVAPRRVGKTSIMKDLACNCPEGFAGIYENIEGVSCKIDFYQRLFELLLQSIHRSKLKQAKELVGRWTNKFRIIEISKSGIKIEAQKIDYEKEIRNLIPELKEAKVHVIIFLDEFAEIIYKLKKNGCQEDAISILHMLREMRSDDDFKHFTIVYAGSVGLEFVIRNIDRPKLINDLHPIKLGVLSDAEASMLISQLTDGASIQLSDDIRVYLKQKISYLLPYYLQLMIEAIDDIAFETKTAVVNEKMIDLAFLNVLKEKKNFEDWLLRLKEYHSVNFSFINELLQHAAHRDHITVQEIYSKAEKAGHSEDYMDFIEELVHDGYLVEIENHIYCFISPLLRQYWLQKYPIYHA
ncbi:MAG: ATP-binding protein [Bacteroidetes bacterium]|nr:ATP-binding protein [Bacteroidota bacterium]